MCVQIEFEHTFRIRYATFSPHYSFFCKNQLISKFEVSLQLTNAIQNNRIQNNRLSIITYINLFFFFNLSIGLNF